MDMRTHDRYVERATANIGRGGLWWWVTALALAACVGFGVYSYAYQVRVGHSATGTNHTIFWGIYIANFVFFIGISYGGAIISAILRLMGAKWRAPITRIAEGTAVVTLAVGAISVIVDVARPDRLLNLVIYAQPGSPITWDWIAINTYLVGTLIFFYLPLIPDLGKYRETLPAGSLRARIYGAIALRWQGTPAQERWLLRAMAIMAVLIIPLAVSVHSVLAWLFAMTVREGWHSTIFGPMFVIAAMLSGTAMVIVAIAALRKAHGLEEFITAKHFRYLSYLLIVLAAAYIYFMVAEYLTEGYTQTGDSGVVLRSLFIGSFAPAFWAIVLGGLVLPIALVLFSGRLFIARASVASLLVIAAMWLKRYLIVLLPGMTATVSPFSLYRPTWVELGITLGSVAAIPLGLMVMFRLFPVMSVHEMEEVEGAVEPAPVRGAIPAYGDGE
jgi:molybdopterin-containing oxidoreductase family membrane subunit